MKKIVLVRHGESEWNKLNLFTGWTDVDLTEKGREEAQSSGDLLKEEAYTFDVAFTSLLKRANKTLNYILEKLDLLWLPTYKSWRLNERHYGALQGLDKAQTAQKYGEEQVLIWRRSYDVPPPCLEESDERYPGFDKRYASLPKAELPLTECLADTVERVIPYWIDNIAPYIKDDKKVLIVAHGNSLRALMMYLKKLTREEVLNLNIPTGVPLVVELNDDLTYKRDYYLGDAEAIQKAISSVASQGKKK